MSITKNGIIFENEYCKDVIGLQAGYNFGSTLIIPDGVEDISAQRKNFHIPESVKKLVIPASLKFMDYPLFSGSDIEEIILKEGFITIFENMFSDTHFLKSVSVPSSLKIIKARAFANSAIRTFDFKNVEIIGKEAFSFSELSHAYLPPSVKKIEPFAFTFSALKSVVIDASLESGKIPSSCFENCKRLIDCKINSKYISTICEDAFRNTFLKSFHVPGTVEVIENNAFSFCENLETFEIENGLVSISDSVFEQSAIEKLTFPKSVRYFGMTCYHMPCLKTLIINAEAEELPRRFASGCEKLENLILSPSIKRLELGCFYNTGLTDFETPRTLEIIDNSAFSNCRKLRKIKISKNIKYIGPNAFANCPELLIALMDTIIIAEPIFGILEDAKRTSFTNENFVLLLSEKLASETSTDFYKNYNKNFVVYNAEKQDDYDTYFGAEKEEIIEFFEGKDETSQADELVKSGKISFRDYCKIIENNK